MWPSVDKTGKTTLRVVLERAEWDPPDPGHPHASGLTDLTKAIYTTTEEQKINDTRLGAVGYAFTRSPAAADVSMAAMIWWRRTASAKSGTV